MDTTVINGATKAQPKVEDLFGFMLKKAGLTKKDVFTVSMKNWIMNNLDVLTPSERKTYAHLFSQ